MEYVYNVSIVCGLIKTYIFSQEIFYKECIPAGSRKEKNALLVGVALLGDSVPPFLAIQINFDTFTFLVP